MKWERRRQTEEDEDRRNLLFRTAKHRTEQTHSNACDNYSCTNSVFKAYKLCSSVSDVLAMTHKRKLVVVVVYALCLFSPTNVATAKGRMKRELKFPKGASFVTAVALSSFLPKGPADGLVHVLEFDLGFPFPEQFSIGKKQPEKKFWKSPHNKPTKWYKGKKTPGKWKRTKRNTKEEQKKDLLLKLEDAINRTGHNGTSCMGRFRCELRDIPPGNSLLRQLLFALFEPTSQTECQGHEKNCPVSLLQIIMHSEEK